MHAFIYIKPFASYPSNQSCMHPWPSFNVHASFFLAWTGTFCSSLWLLCTVHCFSPSTPRVNGFLWSVRRLFSATPRFVQEVGSANSCGSIRCLWIWRTISVGRSFSQLCVRQCRIKLRTNVEGLNITEDVTQLIGKTPMVYLNNIVKGLYRKLLSCYESMQSRGFGVLPVCAYLGAFNLEKWINWLVSQRRSQSIKGRRSCPVYSEVMACTVEIKTVDEYCYRYQWADGLEFWCSPMWFEVRKHRIKSHDPIWILMLHLMPSVLSWGRWFIHGGICVSHPMSHFIIILINWGNWSSKAWPPLGLIIILFHLSPFLISKQSHKFRFSNIFQMTSILFLKFHP